MEDGGSNGLTSEQGSRTYPKGWNRAGGWVAEMGGLDVQSSVIGCGPESCSEETADEEP